MGYTGGIFGVYVGPGTGPVAWLARALQPGRPGQGPGLLKAWAGQIPGSGRAGSEPGPPARAQFDTRTGPRLSKRARRGPSNGSKVGSASGAKASDIGSEQGHWPSSRVFLDMIYCGSLGIYVRYTLPWYYHLMYVRYTWMPVTYTRWLFSELIHLGYN